MGLLQFCIASLFFFVTPSLCLLATANRRRLAQAFAVACLILLCFALWLFPQLSRESLAFSTLLFDLYCYLVLSIGIVAGSVIKAIELKAMRFILPIVIILGAVNLSAMSYSQWL